MPLTNAEKQAAFRRRRTAERANHAAALANIGKARTLAEAQQIALEALDAIHH